MLAFFNSFKLPIILFVTLMAVSSVSFYTIKNLLEAKVLLQVKLDAAETELTAIKNKAGLDTKSAQDAFELRFKNQEEFNLGVQHLDSLTFGDETLPQSTQEMWKWLNQRQ